MFFSKFILTIISCFFILSSVAKADLVVLATPSWDDDYYMDHMGEIFDFNLNFAKKISENEAVLILADKKFYDDYVKILGKNRVLPMPMKDIWIRDFALTNPSHPILFKYTSRAQGDISTSQEQADNVQKKLVDFLQLTDLEYQKTDLLNDGGNWVEDGHGHAIVSTKFLKDNNMSEEEATEAIKSISDIKQIAFIPIAEDDPLQHADGIVSFIDKNTLIINSYIDNPTYSARLREIIQKAMPDVKIHGIITPTIADDSVDETFPSACGLYTNALVTSKHIYLPQFGVPEDIVAVKTVENLTSKKVVPVDASSVCKMGGSLRCLTWQVKGDNALKIVDFIRQKRAEEKAKEENN